MTFTEWKKAAGLPRRITLTRNEWNGKNMVPVTRTAILDIDEDGVQFLAQKATKNKSRKAKDGALSLKGASYQFEERERELGEPTGITVVSGVSGKVLAKVPPPCDHDYDYSFYPAGRCRKCGAHD